MSTVIIRQLLNLGLDSWRTYKRSISGMAGMLIMLTFILLAVLAPVIAPFDPDFTAPSVDVVETDIASTQLRGLYSDVALENCLPPIGTSESYGGALENVLVYCSEGQVVRYDVDIESRGSMQGISLTYRDTKNIPPNMLFLEYCYFRQQCLIGMNGTHLIEFGYDDLEEARSYDIGAGNEHHSRVWNAWSPTNSEGVFACAAASADRLTVLVKVPPRTQFGEFSERTFLRSLSLTDINPGLEETEAIVGNPTLFMSGDPSSESLVIVPSTHQLYAVPIVPVMSGSRVVNITLGPTRWSVPMTELEDLTETELELIPGEAIAAPEIDSWTSGANASAFVGTTQGILFSLNMENGTVDWWSELFTSGMRHPTLDGVYLPAREAVLVTANDGTNGLLMSVDPSDGRIAGNNTEYFLTQGAIDSEPEYIAGNRLYLLSSDQGIVYILDEKMALTGSFSIPGEAATPVSYIGNIFSGMGSYIGNYLAVVTKDSNMYTQSIVGNYIAPLPPGKYPSGNRYLLGTDVFGHDIFSTLIYSTRYELLIGFSAAIIAVVAGTLVGLMAGYYGGWIDAVLMRFVDLFLAIPMLLIALLLASVFGLTITNLIIVIALFSWAGVARVIRAQTISIKGRTFIDAARVSGASHRRIIFKHVFPNVIPFTLLYMMFSISGAIITEAILSFLGWGVPTATTWGMQLQYLRITGHTLNAPWWLVPPGIAIALLSLSFYLIGRGFDEVINPRLRGR